eukprot:TRINITY_DN3029_c0_g1_i2.p1 TRINITY_DN3029_c0_g1~~TRINITY_DN3029_c0_g1_i2.p1  ORF type:complete len:600 (-),score=207.62 TRINITY_DN3029_c0_g1_i2:32-1759(-)
MDASSNGNGVVAEKAPQIVENSAKSRKKKKKQKRKKDRRNDVSFSSSTSSSVPEDNKESNVEIEYVTVNPLEELDINDPLYANFAQVFNHFTVKDEPAENGAGADSNAPEQSKGEENGNKEGEEPKKMSKKEKKRLKRLSIAVLKQLVKRPDVVEAWDVTSADPNLLVFLKSYRNTVPIPRHWNQKRKYLQGKRGIEKPPFQLPEFIAATGISRLRSAIQGKDDTKSLKQKARERMAPKMGRMDIDYRVLHDAFFRYQTKPKLTGHGDLYYEGKEFEITLKEKKPGHLSEDLKRALGMPEGAPPPWLINMQRYGMPPSYPSLKIPGMNSPIPEGARYGYHPGGWGKPPVDEYGRPLFGDVFGLAPPEPPPDIMQPIERTHWGEMLHEEAEEEESNDAEAGENEEGDMGGTETPHPSGTETPSGLTTPSGLETPESLDLRKSAATSRPSREEDDSNKQLYQVLDEKQVSVGGALFGSSHKYVIPEKTQPKYQNRVDLMKSSAGDRVDVALNPSDLENMENFEGVLKKKYEEALDAKHAQPAREDVSDLMAEHQKKKRKKEQPKDSRGGKKYKDFKF